MPERNDQTPICRLTLVLGGARSGKSQHAERLVLASGLAPVYLATAEALDAEMARRIEDHRARRGAAWRTVEEPLDLLDALRRECGVGQAVLVDCLTLWLTNLIVAERDVATEIANLTEGIENLAGAVVMVSNEVGQGIVPDNALARRFVEHAGRLHQAVASQAQSVIFMAAGLPLTLKPAR